MIISINQTTIYSVEQGKRQISPQQTFSKFFVVLHKNKLDKPGRTLYDKNKQNNQIKGPMLT